MSAPSRTDYDSRRRLVKREWSRAARRAVLRGRDSGRGDRLQTLRARSQGRASQVQLVAPKKKTGCAAWGCLTLIILVVVLIVAGQCGIRSTPTPTATRVPPSTAPAEAPILRSVIKVPTGYVGSSKFTVTSDAKGLTAVTFDPSLPHTRQGDGSGLSRHASDVVWNKHESSDRARQLTTQCR
jgi:hypothetical protein